VAVSVVEALQPATAQIVAGAEDYQAVPLATAVTAVTAVVAPVGGMDEDVGLGSKVGLDPAGQRPDMVPQVIVAAVDMVEVDMAAVPAVRKGTMMAVTTATKSACGIERANSSSLGKIGRYRSHAWPEVAASCLHAFDCFFSFLSYLCLYRSRSAFHLHSAAYAWKPGSTPSRIVIVVRIRGMYA